MAKISLDGLDAMQYDVLKEIGNIGAGNATTALSKMLSIKMDYVCSECCITAFSGYFFRDWIRRSDSSWNLTGY